MSSPESDAKLRERKRHTDEKVIEDDDVPKKRKVCLPSSSAYYFGLKFESYHRFIGTGSCDSSKYYNYP